MSPRSKRSAVALAAPAAAVEAGGSYENANPKSNQTVPFKRVKEVAVVRQRTNASRIRLARSQASASIIYMQVHGACSALQTARGKHTTQLVLDRPFASSLCSLGATCWPRIGGGAMMQSFAAATLVLLLISVPVVAGPSGLSFALEFSVGTVAASVPYYAALLRCSDPLHELEASRFTEPTTTDILLGLALPPLAAGATVACVGNLFGVTDKLGGLAAILGASVGEIFALRAWELDLSEWVKVLSVPAITALCATVAFNCQARSLP